jgi:SAM-dependent methyltransferase
MAFLLLSGAMSYNTPDDIPLLRGPVPLSHLFIRRFVRRGDHVVDATCGNGHDTLLLAGLVGQTGRVWAFDTQQEAVESTANRLSEAGYFDSVAVVHAGHETMSEHCSGPVKTVVFNLGYLPGGDRMVVTRPESTLAGLEQSLEIIEPGGVVIISLYPGHEGGQQEGAVLESRLAQLPPAGFHVWRMGQMNVPATAPYVILVQKAV